MTAAARQLQTDNTLRGIIFALTAYFLFALMSAFAKTLFNTGYHIVEIAFYRNLVAIIPFLIIMQVRGGFKNNIPVNKRGIALRGIVGFISLVTTFGAFAYLPMADATAFIFGSSLVLPIIAYFILKEHVGIYRWGAIVIGFIGILIMAQPTGSTTTIGIAFALTTVCLHAIIQSMARWIGRTDTPFVVTFYFILIGLIIGTCLLPLFSTGIPKLEHLWLFLGVGVIGAAGQFCITSAFKNAEASIVTVFNYSGIIWATAFGWFIWNDWPALPIWIGGTIVIASNLFIIYRERKNARKP